MHGPESGWREHGLIGTSSAVRTARSVDRVALVTGAGQGIGRAIAVRLARDGASVLVADIDTESGKATVDAIVANGGTAGFRHVDIRRPEQIEQALATCRHVFGSPPAVAVCNAGVQTFATAMALTSSEWNEVFDVNALGTFETMRLAGKVMSQEGVAGSIIAIASVQGRLGSLYYPHYSASKAAVLSITKSMSLALAPFRVRVNSVAPGIIETALWEKADREIAVIKGVPPGTPQAERIASVPLGRAGTPDDVAGAVAFLASQDSSYITGECIHVCGGDYML